jgi:methyl-accepting chemotaxis protein
LFVRFRDLKVKSKLMAGFAAMALVVLGVSALAVHSLGRQDARFNEYIAGVAERKELATEVRGAANSRAVAARNLVLVTSQADRDAELAVVNHQHERMAKAIANLRKAVQTSPTAHQKDRDFVAAIERVEAQYGPVALGIVKVALDGDKEEAITRMNRDCRPLLRQLVQAAGDYVAYEQEQDDVAVAASASAYVRDRAVLVAACLASALGAMALGLLLSHRVTRPLSRAVTLAEAVAAGDLRSDINVDSRDETGQLLAALKRMNESLSQMVGSVRQSADGIATASDEIASGNQDLSARTEQQASALQQTASSMQQMTSTVQQNAEASRQANQLATLAADVAHKGGEVVQRVVSTMGEISASSARIGDIIGTIDGIAFQTNILALNAAVEAARAGEQGRGFAVVAAEVRSLARRSADAAKEIKTLIGVSLDKVEAGSALVGEAGSTMADIVTQVRRVTDLVAEINASTTEQSSGIVQVNQAVSSIDQGTQQNAALVEQSAAAAQSLKSQAAQLVEAIARFRTAGAVA